MYLPTPPFAPPYRYYIPTAREVQRIESVSRSPIYGKFAEALLGVATIRAYKKSEHFTEVGFGGLGWLLSSRGYKG